mgnify:CR=1 FL=1
MNIRTAMLSLLLSLPGVAAAEDKKIDKDQVPKAVIDAVAARYPAGKLIAFEEYGPMFDEKAFKRLTERGAKAWADVGDAAEWVEGLRGS